MNNLDDKEILEDEAEKGGLVVVEDNEGSADPVAAETVRKNYMEEAMDFARKGFFEIELSKPLRSGAKTFKKLEFDLSKLTAQDMMDCEEQWARQFGRTVQSAPNTVAFRMIVAARALKIPVDDLIRGLTMKESIAVSNCVVSFLMS